jgi:hypothetical protein
MHRERSRAGDPLLLDDTKASLVGGLLALAGGPLLLVTKEQRRGSGFHPLRTLGGPRVARGLTQAGVTRVTKCQVIGRSLSGSSSPALVDHGLDRRAVRRAVEAVGQPRRPQGPRTTSSRARRGARSSRCSRGKVHLRASRFISMPCPHRARSRVPFSVIWPQVIWAASRGSEICLVSSIC